MLLGVVIRLPPRSTLLTRSFPTRLSSELGRAEVARKLVPRGMLGDGRGDAGPALHRSALHRSALSRSAPCRPGVAAVVHRARSTQSPAADNVCNTPRFPHPPANEIGRAHV